MNMTDDNLISDQCNNCNQVTVFEHFGLTPEYFIDNTPEDMHVGELNRHILIDTYICTDCGGIKPNTVSDESEITEYENEYINFLIKHDIVDEEEVEHLQNE